MPPRRRPPRPGLRSGRPGSGRLPTFLVIGAMKSATTSLTHYLDAHPDVYCLQDELHFFSRYYDQGLDWYREQFAGATTERAVGESSPPYMYLPHIPALMARDVPDARLVAILRHPVDRAYSHYWHNRTRGMEPLEFAEAVRAEPGRLATADLRTRLQFAYMDRSRYLPQLERVVQHYPREALHVLLMDDLRDDRVAAVQAVFRFLGVDDTFDPPNLGRAKNRFVTYRFPGVRPAIRRLPGILRKVAARLNIRYTTYPPMDPGLRRELVERFREENEALAAWLGRDLSAWNEPVAATGSARG